MEKDRDSRDPNGHRSIGRGGCFAEAVAATLLMLALCPYPVHAGVTTGIDGQARLPYWQLDEPGMSLRLVQRLPIQTRGFFLARGFNRQQVERIAQSCVFQTVFRNTSNALPNPSSLSYDLRQWKVRAGGREHGLKTREDWSREWRAAHIAKAQELAFEWALYPTRQSYEPGDYNWGMSIFNLPPGTEFDLHLSWRQFGRTHHAVIHHMRCAADINPQPGKDP